MFFTVLSFSSFVFSQNLSITEVFIDGTDEFVEISNMSSTDFYGDLALSGVKSSIVSLSNLSIPAWTSLVVGDNLSMVDTISTIFYKTGLALSIIDSNAFSASLRS